MILLEGYYVSISHVLSFVLFFAVAKADLMDERFRVLYSRTMSCNHNRSLNLDVSDTQIYFYDFVNKIYVTSEINTAVKRIHGSGHLDCSRRLIIFVPGYKCHINRDVEESIKHTFKSVPDVYLIIVDHSAYTYESEDKIGSYLRSVEYSYYIGSRFGIFLSALNDIGFQPDNIHCIGHSLGSHIIGYAAEVFMNITNEKLWKVTGLDPAGPCFSSGSIEEHIRSGIAKYVEVYHCNAGYLGTTRTLADTDFFFNNEGKIQPNCEETDIEETAKCYHTVHHQQLYLGTCCPSYKAFAEGLCDNNHKTMAGYFNPGTARGVYYVSTEGVP